jgi:hypothetical protein
VKRHRASAQATALDTATDTPFTPVNSIASAAHAIFETDLLDEEQKARLFNDNSRALFPRFAQAST